MHGYNMLVSFTNNMLVSFTNLIYQKLKKKKEKKKRNGQKQ